MNLVKIAICIFLPLHILHAQCPNLIFADEFNTTDLDQSKWTYQIGDGCDINLCQWGNSELQWYTNTKENLEVSNGTLKIKALRQTVQSRAYSSARIRSLNKVDIKYGRIECRMKMPVGQGIWPALWMMPTESVYGPWPQSGELDIMEYLGHEPNKVHGTLHFGNPWPNNQSTTKAITLPISKLNEDFHEYVVEWKENEIKWIIDGHIYSTKTPSDLNGQRWPFDQKFHFILNLAVGGNWPGNPNSSTQFPQAFEIDYIRVYDYNAGPYINGSTDVGAGTKNSAYTLQSLPAGSTIQWTVSDGITIVSGADKETVMVNWGSKSGIIKAKVKTNCREYSFALEVKVQAQLATDIVLENFDQTPSIKPTFSSGNLTEKIANPSKTGINTTALVGRYVRNSGSQFDILVYDINDVKLGSEFVAGDRKFYIDIYSTAPVGTQILLQLENKNSATSGNYPTGRHSRFSVLITKQNEWERLSFNFLDRPDAGVSDFGINQLILLFAPNSNTSHTYYFDNFEIYARKTTPLRSGIHSNKLNIYPNPSDGNFNIEILNKSIELVEYSVLDQLGKYIFQNKLTPSAKTIRLPDSIRSGHYILNLKDQKGIQYSKNIQVFRNED